MSRTRRPEAAWEDGADRLRISQQYAGMPQHGLVFRAEQRTTLAGRAVLLMPAQVREVHAWLGDWITRNHVGDDLTAEDAGPLLDPDCRDGKHSSCIGAPCECDCHKTGNTQ